MIQHGEVTLSLTPDISTRELLASIDRTLKCMCSKESQPLEQVETSSLQPAYTEVGTDIIVGITKIYNEDGTFKTYVKHYINSTQPPVEIPDLSTVIPREENW